MRGGHWTILMLVVATLGVMGPLCGHEFTNWDDDSTISRNVRLNPPSWASVGYYWSHAQEGLYVPVTYTAWAGLASVARLEAADEGGVRLNSWVFHTFNVLVHVVNVLLVFAILRLIVGRTEAAACVGALLFAVHPVQVEAVGWVSGTKDLLCGTFSLLAVWQYLLYARRRGEWGSQDEVVGRRRLTPDAHYLIGLVAMVLGILSKPTAMVTPAIVFVLDVWIVGRPWKRAAMAAGGWLLAAVPLMIVARVVQPADQIVGAPVWARPMLAGFSLAFYLVKLLWPARLAFDYGWRPPLLLEHAWFYWAWVAPIGVGALLWWGRGRRPVLWAAALVFVIGLAPVLGLNRFLFQKFSTVADHYLYLSMLGPAIAAAWAVDRAKVRRVAVAVAGVVIVALAVRAAVQAPVWRDSITLNENSVSVTPWAFASYNNLGNAYDDVATGLVKDGRYPEALAAYERTVEMYRAALRTMPDAPPTSKNLAMALVRVAGLDPNPATKGPRLEEAARHLQLAADLPTSAKPVDPGLAEAAKRVEEARRRLAEKRIGG